MESCSNKRETLRFPTVEPLLNDVRFIRTLSFDTSHDLIVNCPPPLPTPQSLSTPVTQDIYFPTFFTDPWFMTADRFHRFLWSRSRNNQLFPFPIYPPLSLPSPSIRTRWKWDFANLETNLIFFIPFFVLFLRPISTFFVSRVHFPLSLSLSAYKGKNYIRSTMYFTIPPIKWLSFVSVYPNLIPRSSNALHLY